MKPKNPSKRQKKAIDLLLSGREHRPQDAMLRAGYSKKTSLLPKKRLFETKGVQYYLHIINKKYEGIHHRNIPQAVMEVLAEGLGAEKLVGRHDKKIPDHLTRLKFAEKIAKYMGWEENQVTQTSKQLNQFNFFSASVEEQKNFNQGLRKMIKDGISPDDDDQ